jgi:predicted amidophosphoribosyltransferase
VLRCRPEDWNYTSVDCRDTYRNRGDSVHCPTCGAEYREGFTSCADCGTPLVESLPEEAEPEFDPFVTIASYRDLPEALVAQAALQGAGILSFLANYYLISIDWMYSIAVRGL